jgi:hypothetical protein
MDRDRGRAAGGRRGDRGQLLSAQDGEPTPDDLKRAMDKVPDVPPDPEDAIPPDLTDRLSHLR